MHIYSLTLLPERAYSNDTPVARNTLGPWFLIPSYKKKNQGFLDSRTPETQVLLNTASSSKFPLPTLCPRNPLREISWENHRAHLVCVFGCCLLVCLFCIMCYLKFNVLKSVDFVRYLLFQAGGKIQFLSFQLIRSRNPGFILRTNKSFRHK